MYYVYLLTCADETIYTGITTDPDRRFREHCAGVGSRYTKAKKAVRLKVIETAPDRSTALKCEAAVKRLSRQEKLRLFFRARKLK